MIALLKAHWVLALAAAVGAWLVLRRRATEAVNPFGVPMSTATKLAAAGAADNGALRNPDDWRPADQNLYPGYYTTQYGGYYNPDTGASYSPGSSPVVYGPNKYETGEATMAYIDVVAAEAAGMAGGAATKIGGEDYNPATANAVIY
jgi:hypothetical protein